MACLKEYSPVAIDHTLAANTAATSVRAKTCLTPPAGQLPRCRTVSYRHNAADTDTLRLSTVPPMGMRAT